MCDNTYELQISCNSLMQFTTNNMHTTQMLKESKTEVVRREKNEAENVADTSVKYSQVYHLWRFRLTEYDAYVELQISLRVRRHVHKQYT